MRESRVHKIHKEHLGEYDIFTEPMCDSRHNSWSIWAKFYQQMEPCYMQELFKDAQRFEVKENSIVDQRGWVAIHKGTGKVVLQSWNKEVLLGFLFSYGREAKKEGRKVTIDIYRRDGWFDHLWINTDSKEKKHVSV